MNINLNQSSHPTFLIVDLFCGFGGTTTGYAMAKAGGNTIAKVIACVNHDPKAIKSHWLNHPDVKHFEEDIRKLDLTELKKVVSINRKLYPNAFLILWASLECTNFSNAKGGQARDADSRTLAEHLDRYVNAIDPEYVKIENVMEFMSWGPLDESGKPVAELKGVDFKKWCDGIDSIGYYNEWRKLNSADFGAYTSRPRLFGCFAKHGLPIVWPSPTHAKSPDENSGLKKWLPVKDKLDFSDLGKSVLSRKKRLSEKTIETIYKGCLKELSREDAFLIQYYGSGDKINSLSKPCRVIPTKAKYALASLFYNFKTKRTETVSNPLGAITTVNKANLLSFILNPSHFGHTTTTSNSCPVIIARQDKAPLYLSVIERGPIDVDLSFFLTDHDIIFISEPNVYGPKLNKSFRVKLIELMVEIGISDIKMRMVKTLELLIIQGFPIDYEMVGNEADKKKFIGNSVHPYVPKAWAEILHGEVTLWLNAA